MTKYKTRRKPISYHKRGGWTKLSNSGDADFLKYYFELGKREITDYIVDITRYEIGELSFDQLYKKYLYAEGTVIMSAKFLTTKIYKYIEENFPDAIELFDRVCVIKDPDLIPTIQQFYADKTVLTDIETYVLISRSFIRTVYPGSDMNAVKNVQFRMLNMQYIKDDYYVIASHDKESLKDDIYATPLENAYLEYYMLRNNLIGRSESFERSLINLGERKQKVFEYIRKKIKVSYNMSPYNFSYMYCYHVKEHLLFRYAKDFVNNADINEILEKMADDLIKYHRDLDVDKIDIKCFLHDILEEDFKYRHTKLQLYNLI